jgi:YebC/PmpR family DNA-binding regulatory protein
MAGHSKWANIQHRGGAQDRRRGLSCSRPRAATGEGGAETCEHVRYEGYGPGGAAVIVECLTEERSRTADELRHLLARHGGHLGAHGSVAYLFNPVGVLGFAPGTRAERLLGAALDAGAEDVVAHPDGSFEVLTAPADFDAVRAALVMAGLEPATAEVTQRSAATADLAIEDAEKMLRLLEALEDRDDVQSVHTNAQIPDEVLARL